MTFRDHVLDRVQASAERVFLIDAFTGREITYAEFHQQAAAVASYLSELGVRRGDRVATIVPNCTELAVVYFACLYCGATIVPVNANLGAAEAQYILTNSKPKCTVATFSTSKKFEGVLREPIILSTSQDQGSASSAHVIALDRLGGAAAFESLGETSADDLAVIVYTSGTTAKPKGLAHHIGRLVRNAMAFADSQRVDSSSRFYLTLSMAYMGGIYNLLLLPFLIGGSVVVDHVFDARSSLTFWERVTKFDVNTLWLAPTILSILLKMDRGHLGEEYCRSAIKKTFVGFAPLPGRVKVDFEKRYGVTLIENYGLSETLFVTARSRPSEELTLDAQGYVGEPLPGICLRVCAENGSIVASGEEGEIQILTPDLMAGYITNTGDLQRVDAGEWFSSGDYGCVSEGGSLSITGRKKDLIIRGGVNVSPAAIEEVLLRAAHVNDAAVISVPHEIYGEDIVAVLKLDSGVELESVLDSIMSECKQALAAHQQPSRYMAIDEFPRTSNGKIQKVKLRELVWNKLQVATPVATDGQASLARSLSLKQGIRA
jgi:long-chain acyl-CoA synthetase